MSGGEAFVAEIWENQMAAGGGGWTATGFNYTNSSSWTLYAVAYCSPNIAVSGVSTALLSEAEKVRMVELRRAELSE